MDQDRTSYPADTEKMMEQKHELDIGYGQEIDPETCCCGDLIDHSPWAGHMPVPMGCVCGYDLKSDPTGASGDVKRETDTNAQKLDSADAH